LELSFNSFIIYIANNILKEHPFKGIELVLFFLVIYFVSINLIYVVRKKFDIQKLEKFFLRIIMWTLLILAFNYLIYIFKINLKELRVVDILLVPIIIFVHSLIKFLFTFFETLIKKKYSDYITKYLIYIIIDSIFIFFSIIVGSVYTKIGILNTSFFIAFLAVIIMLVRYMSGYNGEQILYYSINSFVDGGNISPNNFFSYLPLKKRINLNHYIKQDINYLLFVMITLKDSQKINKKIKDGLPKDYKYYLLDLSTIVTILPTKNDSVSQIEKIKQEIPNTIITYCFIKRDRWHSIEISYLFKSLFTILKNIKEKSDIIEVKEDTIF